MPIENSLTHRGRQLLEAIQVSLARYEDLPRSPVRSALMKAARDAEEALSLDRKYRLRDLPDLPRVDPHAAVMARMKAMDALLPPLDDKKITLTRKIANAPISPSTDGSQPKKPSRSVIFPEGLPVRSARNGKP